MSFACQKLALNEEENFTSTTCNRQGKWDPDPAEFCAITLGKHMCDYEFTSIIIYILRINWQRSKALRHSLDHIKG